MIIFSPDKHIVRTKFLMPIPEKQWREPSIAVPRDDLGNPVSQTRFRIRAKTHDGVVLWTGWFDSRDDFDAFLWAIVTGSLNRERPLWDLPSPMWPGLDPDLLYDFSALQFMTTSGTWTRYADWNNADNTIEALGAGGDGWTASSSGGGAGGGAGAYAKITNFTAASTETVQIGVRNGTTGSGTSPTANTYLKNGSTLVAAGGGSATGIGSNIGSGGIVANCYPTSGAYKGGDGGAGASSGMLADGGGGGGAGGKNAAGNDGLDYNSTTGGHGDGTYGGDGGSYGYNGSDGTEWDGSHGSGGGGGGGHSLGTQNGGAGGNYSGAGGGGATSSAGGQGKGGLLAFIYTPKHGGGFGHIGGMGI